MFTFSDFAMKHRIGKISAVIDSRYKPRPQFLSLSSSKKKAEGMPCLEVESESWQT